MDFIVWLHSFVKIIIAKLVQLGLGTLNDGLWWNRVKRGYKRHLSGAHNFRFWWFGFGGATK